jgi:hypothetical protein
MSAESSEDFTLVRGFDLSYAPNKVLFAVLLLVIPITLSWQMFTGETIVQSLMQTMLQVILVFLCWSIGRELDPDHDYAAFFGIVLLFLPFTITQGNIFVLLWFLLGLRLLTCTTGRLVSSTDVLVYVFLSFLAALATSAILVVPLAIIVIFLSAVLPKKQPGLGLLSIPLFPGFILLTLITPGAWCLLNVSPLVLIYIAVSSALLFLVTTTTDSINCTGDHSMKHLSVKRVQTAQLISVLSVLILSTFHGNILFVFPLWAAITGVGMYRLIHLFIK